MATNRLNTFAPNQVVITITHTATGEVHTISGVSEDQIVTIDRNAETYSMYRGADNSKTRIYDADTSATITIPLQQTSSSNDFLQWVYNYDRERQNSEGLFSILIKDLSGRSNYFDDQAYIGNVPSAAFANSMQLREWVIHAPSLESETGGNSKFDAAEAAAIVALGGSVDPQWQP